jgi:nucleoside-diphosphate-sugar epimerase
MKIMVTAGAGYLGSQLLPALIRAGFQIVVVDSLLFGKEGLADFLGLIELEMIDIRQLRPEHFKGVDAVIHLAGISNDPTAEFDPPANKAINLDATTRLARLAKKSGVGRFIFASSCSVYYTEQPDNCLRDEKCPVAPSAPYSWSKRQAEIELLEFASPGFCPVILRKGTIFGYSGRMRFDLVINTFTRDAFSRGRLTVNGEGKMWRPMLHIEDAVGIYLAMLILPEHEISGEIFNVLNDNYQVIDIASQVRQFLESKKSIDLDILKGGNARSYRVDGTKLNTLLGTKPGRTIGDAVDKMWNLLETGIDFNDEIYYNIRRFESMRKEKFHPHTVAI